MSPVRTGRRTYYDIFSHIYDAFVKVHARRDAGDTRSFLVKMAQLERIESPTILDLCCGTGAVVVAFAQHYRESLTIGYDFSRGMLRRARSHPDAHLVRFIEGDAVTLPFTDGSFDVITCSHALYELKGQAREAALREMKRAVRPTGIVLVMEHEVPQHPVKKFLFNLRMMAMGAVDAREFVYGGLVPFKRVFPNVVLTHSPSGKSKLILCRKIPQDKR